MTPRIKEIDTDFVSRFPNEYAALAYLLGTSGFPVKRSFPTRGSAQENMIKTDAVRWLGGYGD